MTQVPVELDDKTGIFGIPGDTCFVCGKLATNRHHSIMLAMKPVQNVTIPLCNEHKDCQHTIVKQMYFPKTLRNKIGRLKKHIDIMQAMMTKFQNGKDISMSKLKMQINNASLIVTSIRSELQFHKKYDATKIQRANLESLLGG